LEQHQLPFNMYSWPTGSSHSKNQLSGNGNMFICWLLFSLIPASNCTGSEAAAIAT